MSDVVTQGIEQIVHAIELKQQAKEWGARLEIYEQVVFGGQYIAPGTALVYTDAKVEFINDPTKDMFGVFVLQFNTSAGIERYVIPDNMVRDILPTLGGVVLQEAVTLLEGNAKKAMRQAKDLSANIVKELEEN